MLSPLPDSQLPAATLLADYNRWLMFALTSQKTTHQYTHQLLSVEMLNPDFSEFTRYLRDCMFQRGQFFGRLVSLLSNSLERLRTESTNTDLIRRLTHAHPTMQSLISQLTEAFTEIEQAYQTLPVLSGPLGNSN